MLKVTKAMLPTTSMCVCVFVISHSALDAHPIDDARERKKSEVIRRENEKARE